MQEEREPDFMDSSDIYGESCLTQTTQCLKICFNWLLCGCFRNTEDAQISPEETENQDFWDGFEMAFSALKNPIILGELERGTFDVKITYINQAAEEFTDYRNIPFNEDHPSGIIGRSVTTLMSDDVAQNHARYVRHWINNPRLFCSSDDNSYSRTSRYSDSDHKSVENIRRDVEILTAQNKLVRTQATISFFAAKGRGKRAVGVFSIENLPRIPRFSLKNVTIKMKYKNEKDRHFTQVIITPPEDLREFTNDKKWQFQQLGGITSEEVRENCKMIIYKQLNEKLTDIAAANNLQVTLINPDDSTLDEATAKSVYNTMIDLINSDSSEENMHMHITPYIDRAVEEQDDLIVTHTPCFGRQKP